MHITDLMDAIKRHNELNAPLPDRSRLKTAWCQTCPAEKFARKRKNGAILCPRCNDILEMSEGSSALLTRIAEVAKS